MRDQILSRMASLEAEYGRPTRPLKIALYPSRDDYRYMRPNDLWSWEHHTAVAQLLPGLLREAGYEVRLVDCTAAGCMSWLDAMGKTNDQAGRAAYVGSITAG